MKKVLGIILATSTIFVLTSCGKNNKENDQKYTKEDETGEKVNTSEDLNKEKTFGDYKLSSISLKTDTQFNPATDFVSIGFRTVGTDNIYVGASEWSYEEKAKQLYMHGMLSIPDTSELYELVNIGSQTIYLDTPDLKNIKSKSYFTNSLVTIIIEYLGKQRE